MTTSFPRCNSSRNCAAAVFLIFAWFTDDGISPTLRAARRSEPAEVVVNTTVSLAPSPVGGSTALEKGEQARLALTLHAVVILQKAGPMGRGSYWDEYVVSLAGGCGRPVVIESAVLTDAKGFPVPPGDNPWTLANRKKSAFERTNTHGVTSPGKIVAGTLTVGIVGGAIIPFASPPLVMASASQPLAAMAVGAVIMTPVYAIKAVSFNVNGRKKVEAEFDQRRLVLPLTIEQGRTARGSLYFPVTASPQRLVLHCRVDETEQELVLPLPALAKLHCKPPLKPIWTRHREKKAPK
jgi:hypothetical protein